MRALSLLLALLTLLSAGVLAVARPLGGVPGVIIVGCGGNPSPDGCAITGPTSVVATDLNGNTWQFDGALGPNYSLGSAPLGVVSWGVTRNGTEVTTGWNQVQINNGHHAYVLEANAGGPGCYKWKLFNNGSGNFTQQVNPTSGALGNIFTNSTAGTSFTDPQTMLAFAAAGATLNYPPVPAGICGWDAPGFMNQNGLTINCAAGAAIYSGTLEVIGNGQTIQNCELGFTQGPGNAPASAVNIHRGTQTPVFNNVFVHDSDDGILAGGVNGTLTVTNTVISHNSFYNGSGDCAGFGHNLYFAYSNGGNTPPDDTGFVNISATSSRDVRCQGDPYKLRVNGGSLTNFDAVACTGAFGTDCGSNWAVDMPCGGPYTVSHGVLERGPNNFPNTGSYSNSIVSYGEEWPGSISDPWNCPPNITVTGSTTLNSNQLSSVAGANLVNVVNGAVVTGSGIPAGTKIVSGAGTATVTMSANATATATGVTLTTTRTMTLVMDTVTTVNDGTLGSGRPSFVVQCGPSQPSCTSLATPRLITVKNSNIILSGPSDPLQCTNGIASVVGPGVTDGGGNQCFQTRAAAATALAWNTTDVNGRLCAASNGCPFPAIPPRP